MKIRSMMLIASSAVANLVGAQTVVPSTSLNRSDSLKGELSNTACYPERVNAGGANGVILHRSKNPNPKMQTFGVVSGRSVSSCAILEVNAVVPSALTVEYRTISGAVDDTITACSDGAAGSEIGTGGELEIFTSPDPSRTADQSWNYLITLPRQTTFTQTSWPISGRTVRSVLLCRNAASPDKDDVEVRALTLQATSQAVTSAPSAESPYLKNLHSYWNTAFQSITAVGDPNQGIQDTSDWTKSYSAYFAYPLMSGWAVFQKPEWKFQAEQQLNWAYQNRIHPVYGLPTNPWRRNGSGQWIHAPNEVGFKRDTIAREALAYYHAYSIFGTKKYLTWAEGIADAMIANLDLVDVPDPRNATAPKFRLFQAQYYHRDDIVGDGSTETRCSIKRASNVDGAYVDGGNNVVFNNNICQWDYESGYIDPNQNAEVGLLFTALLFDRKSSYYTDAQKHATAIGLARDHLNSAISVQKTSGALPPGINFTSQVKLDTNYASYTFSLLAEANSYWNDSAYGAVLYKGGEWLKNNFSVAPNYSYINSNGELCDGTGTGQVPCERSLEMWWRIPALYAYDPNTKLTAFGGEYIKKLYSLERATPQAHAWLSEMRFDGRMLFLKAGGIPMDYYLPKTAPMSIVMNPQYVPYNGTVNISWQSLNMVSCELRSIIPALGIDSPWDTAKNGSGTNGGLKWPTKMQFKCLDAHGMVQEVTGETFVQ